MKIAIITLFPEMFEGPLSHSMLLKAQKLKLAEFTIINLRDYGEGERRMVDDTPYGGGDGMLLKPGPVVEAIEQSKKLLPEGRVILLSPRGQNLVQAKVKQLASENRDLILVCGRYEGFDERIRSYVDEEISIGNYVLTGGEIPALVVIDSVVRLIPGVLGGERSAEVESFDDGATVEFPQYTRPEDFRGRRVPDVLLSGHHGEIEQWRSQEAQRLTELRNRSDNRESEKSD
ncbi:MAG: tRNA (guanosine(37)-N1)-methyltransferase TrmD [Candidatus Saccharimonadales bacterium]|nr:tRNA (guanosine(37)-N1)-methyltransferase TrmD [Candidatus Saccharimonadales bacterium]